jgi:hypothetical protein
LNDTPTKGMPIERSPFVTVRRSGSKTRSGADSPKPDVAGTPKSTSRSTASFAGKLQAGIFHNKISPKTFS